MSATATPFAEIADKATIISGFPKSGTTLLAALLDNHPQLTTMPEELKFFAKVYGKDHLLERLLQTNPFAAFRQGKVSTVTRGSGGQRDYSNLDAQAVEQRVRQLCAGATEPKAFLLAAMQAWHEAQPLAICPKRRWVEKTPGNEAYLAILDQWFGQ